MAQITIPPWLNSNPAEPAQAFLHAFGQGAQIGQANRANERDEAMLELQQQQEERMNRLRSTAQEIQIAQLGQHLTLQKEAADREKQIALTQLEGQKGLQADLDAGMTLEEAFPKWAPKLLARHPEAIGREMKALRPPPKPAFIPESPETGPAHWESGTGGIHVPPASYSEQPFGVPQVAEIAPGIHAAQIGPKRWQVLDKPAKEAIAGSLSDVDKARIRHLEAEGTAINKKLEEPSWYGRGKDKYTKDTNRLAQITAELSDIYDQSNAKGGTRGLPRSKAIKGPAVGSVQGGYRFKGGDPADKSNWEPVAVGKVHETSDDLSDEEE